MGRPAVTFANPRRAIINYLEAQLTPLPVGAPFPTEATGETLGDGYVQVGWDGTPVIDYPITMRATVRVTAWASGPTAAEDLAGRVLQAMACHPGDDSVFHVLPLAGPLPGVDPETGHAYAWTSFRVSARPEAA